MKNIILTTLAMITLTSLNIFGTEGIQLYDSSLNELNRNNIPANNFPKVYNHIRSLSEYDLKKINETDAETEELVLAGSIWGSKMWDQLTFFPNLKSLSIRNLNQNSLHTFEQWKHFFNVINKLNIESLDLSKMFVVDEYFSLFALPSSLKYIDISETGIFGDCLKVLEEKDIKVNYANTYASK